MNAINFGGGFMSDLIRRAIAGLLVLMIGIGGFVDEVRAANVNANFQFGFGTGSIGCTKFNKSIEVNVTGSVDDVFLDNQSNFDKNVYVDSVQFYGTVDALPLEMTTGNGRIKNILSGAFVNLDPYGSFGLAGQYASGFEGREFSASEAPVVTGKYNGFILLKREGKVFAKPNIAVSTSTVTTKFLTFTCGNLDNDESYLKTTRIQDMPRVIVRQIGRTVSTPETIQQLLREIQKQSVKVRVRVR
jgi:hypothetical protein